MRFIVITENPLTGERTTVETKDYEALRIAHAELGAIVDKTTQQVTYDGETRDDSDKAYS